MMHSPIRQLMLTLLASTAISSQAYALEMSGSAVKVDRITNANGPGGQRVLETSGDVFSGDAIVTDPNGLAQIRFIDNTRIVVGPNSRLIIDSFVFNPDNTARSVTVSAVRGVFRFISGGSPQDSYSLRTPTMVIGVRGTALDINARGPDSSVMFLSGSGTACDAGGSCIEITEICDLFVAPRGGGIVEATGIDRQQRISAFFPLLRNPALHADFRVATNCNTADPRFFAPPEEPYGRKHASESPSEPSSPPPPPPPPPPPSPPPPP